MIATLFGTRVLLGHGERRVKRRSGPSSPAGPDRSGPAEMLSLDRAVKTRDSRSNGYFCTRAKNVSTSSFTPSM